MHVYPLIFDARLLPAGHGGVAPTLLEMPYGFESVLHRVLDSVERVTFSKPTIVPTFEPDRGYAERLRRGAGRDLDVHATPTLGAWLERREPADLLLFVDPRFWPVDGVDYTALVDDLTDQRVARNLVVFDSSAHGTEELAHLDAHGNVKRIQRYYDSVTRVRARGVAATLTPATACHPLAGKPWESLQWLRMSLAQAGVSSVDLPLGGQVIDLATPRGVLDLNEYALRSDSLLQAPPRYHEHQPGVFVGPDVLIDERAELVGPVVIHERCVIERNALVVGPAVIGRNVVIGNDAVVAQSVIAPGVNVFPLCSVRHRTMLTESAEGEEPQATPSAISRSAVAIQDSGLPPRRGRGRSWGYAVAKRMTDVVLSAFGLLVLSPLLLVIALAVKITSRGPILFAHEREGRGGRVFRCYKFRTMTPDAHARQRELYSASATDGPQFKIDKDPRLTPIGGFLRDYCLDELPQLINVLLGTMSLVGPRPSPFRENQICVPWRNARLSVRPGMTGLWQVCRSQRSLGDFHQWIHYDILYVRNRSYWLDWKILIATLLTGGRRSVPVEWLIPRSRLSAWDASVPPVDEFEVPEQAVSDNPVAT
ncbi:MAG: hypothetical protein D6744_05885 [Planctomycetota bacterium]|nr:MAG: hypothetical protein D6744_05885 [Planctomycetota bacterium]